MTRLTPTLLTFDAGGVLIELDLDFLSRRLRERGLAVPPERLAAALPSAWEHHDMLVEHGARHPWQALMATLLKDSGWMSRCGQLTPYGTPNTGRPTSSSRPPLPRTSA